VQIECPEYEGPYPSLSLIKQAHQKMYDGFKKKEDAFFSVKKALHTGFGGVSYVASGLFTKSGQFVGKKFHYDLKKFTLMHFKFKFG
jgi:hypothetical protein